MTFSVSFKRFERIVYCEAMSESFTHVLYITFQKLDQPVQEFLTGDILEHLPVDLKRLVSLFFKQGGCRLTLRYLEEWHLLDAEVFEDTINLICCPELQMLNPREHKECVPFLSELSNRLNAFLLLDVPAFVKGTDALKTWFEAESYMQLKTGALYYPNLIIDGVETPPSLLAAALFEHNDRVYGILRCPSGTTLPFLPEISPSLKLTNQETLDLNWIGINCIRHFNSSGTVLWGRKTTLGNDDDTTPWKYVFVVRTVQFISKIVRYYVSQLGFEDDVVEAVSIPEVTALFHEFYQKGFFLGDYLEESYYIKRVTQDAKTQVYIGAKLLHKDQFVEWSVS